MGGLFSIVDRAARLGAHALKVVPLDNFRADVVPCIPRATSRAEVPRVRLAQVLGNGLALVDRDPVLVGRALEWVVLRD